MTRATTDDTEKTWIDERLWDYMIAQEGDVVSQFGLGLVGVGALFFAYGSIGRSPDVFLVRQIIALAGLGASVILCVHVNNARREYDTIRYTLRPRQQELMDYIAQAKGGWGSGHVIPQLMRVKILMMGYLGFLSLAWLDIILSDYGVSLSASVLLDVAILLVVIALVYSLRRSPVFKSA